jgi:hypothetical protein
MTTLDLPTKIVVHCLPKTASTTLRIACKRLVDKKCPNLPKRNDPYGYRNPTEFYFYFAVRSCNDVHQFCVQGGDLSMNVIGYSGYNKGISDEEESNINSIPMSALRVEEKKDEPSMTALHFVHLIPFRNFNEWAESALKQIYEVDGSCDLINEILGKCLGYRELYMDLYTKTVLAGLLGMSLDSNKNASKGSDKIWRRHEHHIVLYNFQDTDGILQKMSQLFHIESMPHTSAKYKGERSEGTCLDETLQAFHKCHDETLNSMDVIRDLQL